ncbi:MAG: GAF domain-containing sensor histidine kinase [Candidatus Kaistia colombiensis]|nr:MAG: GAF domain-containing sensor histidine kinase [Kaistia sp.]
MGFAGGGLVEPRGVLARPLYRDDKDGTQALRLKRLVNTDLSGDDRPRLLGRLERAVLVTGGRWAALLIGDPGGADILVTDAVPATIHRQLGELRLRQSAPFSALIFPIHLIRAAASQGYAIQGAAIGAPGNEQGYLIVGFPAHAKVEDRRGALVQLVADELANYIETRDLTGQIERIRRHLSLIHRLGQQVTAIHDRDELFAEITRLIHQSLGYEHIQLLLVEPDTRSVVLAHASGSFAELLLGAGFREPTGFGIIGRVAETGQPWISPDVTTDTHFVSHPLLPHTASELALPLRLGQRVIGVLDIQSDRRDAFRRDDVILLQTIADQIAPAIEQHRLFAAERRERELANTLADVSRIISSILEPDHVLEAVLQELGRVVPHLGSRVTLLGDDGLMRVVAAKGYPDNERVKQVVFRREAAPLSTPVLYRHETIILSDVRDEPQWVWQPGTEQVCSWCSAPLVIGMECIGWLCVDWPEPDFYTPEHGRIVRAFADQAVVAIENARLFAREKEFNDVLEQKVGERTSQLRDAHDEIARKADELQALWQRVVDVQEDERRRIAYDLHDSVAQSILASTYELQAVRRRNQNEALDARLIQCQRMLDDTLHEMKQIIYALRPTILDELGLIPALENYLASLPTQSGLVATLHVEGEAFGLLADIDLAIYRIVQEACQNAVRHADARTIELRLAFQKERLRVSVRDDGRGFVLDQARHGLGLIGIRERARSLGGLLTLNSEIGRGTEITLDLPKKGARPCPSE